MKTGTLKPKSFPEVCNCNYVYITFKKQFAVFTWLNTTMFCTLVPQSMWPLFKLDNHLTLVSNV